MATSTLISLLVTHYNLSQTKGNGYIVTVSKGLRRIVTSYLGTECTIPSAYLLHRYSYFPKNDCYKRQTSMVTTICIILVMSNEITILCQPLLVSAPCSSVEVGCRSVPTC
jgi:hypothetical protein